MTRNNRQHWLIKYKIYHLPFWMIYHFIWWSISSGDPVLALKNILWSDYSAKYLFYVLFQALGVYFNLYWLIPKLLQKSHYKSYLVTLILTIVVTAGCITGGYFLTSYLVGKPFEVLFFQPATEWLSIFKSNALPSTAASMTLAMSIKLAKSWLQAHQEKQQLIQEKLETELKFLRSQFNPHFLFNTINSIFVLIHKNPDMASESLAKFSNLLRYQLYECAEMQIPLTKELDYIENFIELEQLRVDHHMDIKVDLQRTGQGDWLIAPFILMPFFENAFKHVSQFPDKANWINISLQLDGNTLYLIVKNSTNQYSKIENDLVNYGGIGLQNVQRRLDLLYPNSHELRMSETKEYFAVNLSIELTKPTRNSNQSTKQLVSS